MSDTVPHHNSLVEHRRCQYNHFFYTLCALHPFASLSSCQTKISTRYIPPLRVKSRPTHQTLPGIYQASFQFESIDSNITLRFITKKTQCPACIFPSLRRVLLSATIVVSAPSRLRTRRPSIPASASTKLYARTTISRSTLLVGFHAKDTRGRN